MKYKVYLKSGAAIEINNEIPYIENESRIFFCESEVQAEKLISSGYSTVGENLVSYFEKSEIAGIEFPKARTGSQLGSSYRSAKPKRNDKYVGY